MLFYSLKDFESKTSGLKLIGREEEIDCARRMQSGDKAARERLIEGYLPMVVSHTKRWPDDWRIFGMVCYCLSALEKAVDSFNFLQDSEPFVHRLSWALRQACTRYIAYHRNPPEDR